MPLTHVSARERDRRRSRRLTFDAADSMLIAATFIAVIVIAATYFGRVRVARLNDTVSTVNLNAVSDADALLPALSEIFVNEADRRLASRELFRLVVADDGTRRELPNVGAIMRARVPADVVQKTRGLGVFSARLQEQRTLAAKNGQPPPASVAVFGAGDLSTLKPQMAVRTYGTFGRSTLVYGAAYMAAFLLVASVWRLTGVDGDRVVLAAAQLLTAIGFAALLSRPDPLRDTLLFERYAQTVIAGLIALLGISMIKFQKIESLRLTYLSLFVAFGLSVVLLIFGSGPGTSEAKVNLGPVQPIEAIRLALAFFLAGYFSTRWQLLRNLRSRTVRSVTVPDWLVLPRMEYVLPVAGGVGLSLLFFFFQKDLGPALFICCVFLAMYGVARGRATMAVAGLAMLVAGFYIGHRWHVSSTLDARVEMWISPWDNTAAGGNQVTHAIWAMATGGFGGAGLGSGASRYLPAGHTDLILAAVGEELGLIGLTAVALLFAVIAWRGFRAARAAAGDYGYFLALALTLFLIVPVLIMAAGIMGLTPLTGVVTPLLSYGGSAMVANFAALGLLSSIHADGREAGDTEPFRVPARWLVTTLAAAGVVLVASAVYIQLIRADALAIRPHLGLQADGGKRFEYNPRLLEIVRQLKSGSLVDPTGLPLATTSPEVIGAAKERYRGMGINLAAACPRPGERCYPLGDRAFHLLGDARTRANWSAPNTSYIERDAEDLLRGFNDHATAVETTTADGRPMLTLRRDYSDLLPALRHRYEPNHPAMVKLMDVPPDLPVTISAELQYRVAGIVADYARRSSGRAAAVVIDPDTGALLASASYPWPSALTGLPIDRYLDRARYGVYPPGSTFKIVVESALLRSDFDPSTANFTCSRLPDGRAGAEIKGYGRPVRDDVKDKAPHGTIGLRDGLVHSCNAYFGQLAVTLGPQPIIDAATALGISLTPAQDQTKRVRETLPQVGYGQGDVLASPLRMARAVGAIAAGGLLRDVRWRTGQEPAKADSFLSPVAAARVAADMRDVVTRGTGGALKDHPGVIAGKTGTAEVTGKPSHGWFIGFAPYGQAQEPPTKRIAFAVIIENAGYGGITAAPAAGEIVSAAIAAGLVKR